MLYFKALLLSLFILVSIKFVFANVNEGNKTTLLDYVPNEETAKKIAEAIWLPIYGEKIYDEKPYVASLLNDSVWIVKGTLSKGKRGGVAYIEIQKGNCKILKVSHGK